MLTPHVAVSIEHDGWDSEDLWVVSKGESKAKRRTLVRTCPFRTRMASIYSASLVRMEYLSGIVSSLVHTRSTCETAGYIRSLKKIAQC